MLFSKFSRQFEVRQKPSCKVKSITASVNNELQSAIVSEISSCLEFR